MTITVADAHGDITERNVDTIVLTQNTSDIVMRLSAESRPLQVGVGRACLLALALVLMCSHVVDMADVMACVCVCVCVLHAKIVHVARVYAYTCQCLCMCTEIHLFLECIVFGELCVVELALVRSIASLFEAFNRLADFDAPAPPASCSSMVSLARRRAKCLPRLRPMRTWP